VYRGQQRRRDQLVFFLRLFSYILTKAFKVPPAERVPVNAGGRRQYAANTLVFGLGRQGLPNLTD
jgi:hypothetical protein